MTWEYGIMGLITGIIIGAVTMRFGNKKLREQNNIQYKLQQSKIELANYREEISNHFERSAELLDNMAHDYRKFYNHIAKNSNKLLSHKINGKNLFTYKFKETEIDNDQLPVQTPRDYSEESSGLLRNNRTSGH
ncbi:Z-ring associated protein ZapG [Pantoea sp. Aalb]|uniref:Z-ring associated protein ZapG n=1 Tax=Pantoea sp. Aalb TaxID=2576762 RepID=UPI001329362C|nr:Z-ring associated protein ZapG [Pantoea sp. Aalb]MXP67807.1 DUF1043 family protein [Pantoea sp. Aalb]